MPLGLDANCRREVYAVSTDPNTGLEVRGPDLPICRVEVADGKCPPVRAQVVFSADDPFWLTNSFDFSCDFIAVDRVCDLPNGAETRERLFTGAAEAPSPIDIGASTFSFPFIDNYGIRGACPIPKDFIGSFDALQLMIDLLACADIDASGSFTPPVAYPALPVTPIVITAATHPAGPMSDPTFAALVAWCNSRGWNTSGLSANDFGYNYVGPPLDIETFLYADEPGPGGTANGNPGPWDEADIESFPYADGQTRTVVYERYVVNPDGSICRETSIDRAGDGTPPFQPQVFNRCVTDCPVPGTIVRDIRREACLDVATEVKSIATEAGFVIRYDQETGEAFISQDPGADLPELRLSTLENLCAARLLPASGGYNHICLTGTDGAYSNISIPSPCRKKVKKGKVQVGQDDINAAALSILLACSDPTPACEVVIDPECSSLGLVGTTDQQTTLPEVCQYATVELANTAGDGEVCPHPSNSVSERKPITVRTIAYDEDGNETIGLTIGTAPPTVDELLASLLERLS